MRLVLIAWLVSVGFSLCGQIKLNKNLKYAAPFQVVAGFADGTNQAYLFHYHNSGLFEKWNIKPNGEAWVNKWKIDPDGTVLVGQERFFGSSTFLVFTTDFHHATRFVENRFNEGTGLVYAIGHGAKRKRIIDYLADFGILFISRSVGFYASYSLIFK